MISLSSIIASLKSAESLQDDLSGATADDQKVIKDRIGTIISTAMTDLKATGKGITGHDLPFGQ